MALTPEQIKALSDSLFALPDAVKAAKKAPAAKTATALPPVKPQRLRTILALTSKGYLPALKIISIIHQDCGCCGGQSEYILPAVIRFEQTRNGAAIEIPASVEEHLPVSIKEEWQSVSQCPKCIHLSRNIDDFICMQPMHMQLELFA